jgi:hypothetical protein
MDVLETDILAEIRVDQGYYDTDLLAAPSGAMVRGSRNVFMTDGTNQKVFKGLLEDGVGGRSLFNIAGGHASLNDDGDTQGVGNVFNYINESLMMMGAGRLYINGSDTGIDASSSLQIAPKGDGYTYPDWYAAGLAQPDAPTVIAMTPSEGNSGLLTGLFSFKIAAVRSVTGARSIASVTSAVITCTGETVRMTFPAVTEESGQDRWAIFGTKTGFGGTGVHYLIDEIAIADLTTIDDVANSYEIEYNDSDLLPITAYLDDYVPQAGLFAARLENYALIIGCYDNAIASSIRNFPESFNPEHLAFIPKAPTAILSDPQGAYLYVSTDSSVHIVSVIPSTDNPLVVQTVWSSVGVANSHNWCSVGGVIFAFTAKAKAVTMNVMGQPTQEFAIPVSRAMRDWEVEDTSVFEAPHLNSVIFTNGGEAFAFNIQTGLWSSPAMYTDLASGDVVAGFVKDRKPYVSLLDGSDFTLYEFDNGTAPVEAVIQTPPIVPMQGYRCNILGLKSEFYAPETGTYTTDLLVDYDDDEVETLSHTTLLDGMQSTVQSRWFVPRKESFACRWTGTQSDFTRDMYVSRILVYGTLEQSNKMTRTTEEALVSDSGAIPITSDSGAVPITVG